MAELQKVTVSGIDYKPPEAVTTPQRPEHIPEKFWDTTKNAVNVDAMAASYAELEKTRSAPTPPPAKIPEGGPIPEGTGIFTESNMNRWSQELQANNNQLTAESYAELGKAGIPRPMVDIWIKNNQSATQNEFQQAYQLAGGEENYAAMSGWAKDNLSPEERSAYNKSVEAGGATRSQAIQGLHARYTQAEGSPATRRLVGEHAGITKEAFATTGDMIHAMRDPRYKVESPKHDPAYRREVMRRAGVNA